MTKPLSTSVVLNPESGASFPSAEKKPKPKKKQKQKQKPKTKTNAKVFDVFVKYFRFANELVMSKIDDDKTSAAAAKKERALIKKFMKNTFPLLQGNWWENKQKLIQAIGRYAKEMPPKLFIACVEALKRFLNGRDFADLYQESQSSVASDSVEIGAERLKIDKTHRFETTKYRYKVFSYADVSESPELQELNGKLDGLVAKCETENNLKSNGIIVDFLCSVGRYVAEHPIKSLGICLLIASAFFLPGVSAKKTDDSAGADANLAEGGSLDSNSVTTLSQSNLVGLASPSSVLPEVEKPFTKAFVEEIVADDKNKDVRLEDSVTGDAGDVQDQDVSSKASSGASPVDQPIVGLAPVGNNTAIQTFPINTQTYGAQSNSRVLFNPSTGIGANVWIGYNPQTEGTNYYVRKFSADGSFLGNDSILPTLNLQPTYSTSYDATILTDGRLALVTCSGVLKVQIFNTDLTYQTSFDIVVIRTCCPAHIIAFPNQNYAVYWADYDSAISTRIPNMLYYQLYDQNNNVLVSASPLFSVLNVPSNCYTLYTANAVIFPDNTFGVAFDLQGDCYYGGIFGYTYYAYFNNTGLTITQPTLITTTFGTSGAGFYPQVFAIPNSNNIDIVYLDNHLPTLYSTVSAVYQRVISKEGVISQDAQPLLPIYTGNPSVPPYCAYSYSAYPSANLPFAAIGSDKSFVLVWQDARNGLTKNWSLQEFNFTGIPIDTTYYLPGSASSNTNPFSCVNYWKNDATSKNLRCSWTDNDQSSTGIFGADFTYSLNMPRLLQPLPQPEDVDHDIATFSYTVPTGYFIRQGSSLTYAGHPDSQAITCVPSSTVTCTGVHPKSDVGKHTITFTATDKFGGVASTAVTYNVYNVGPTPTNQYIKGNQEGLVHLTTANLGVADDDDIAYPERLIYSFPTQLHSQLELGSAVGQKISSCTYQQVLDSSGSDTNKWLYMRFDGSSNTPVLWSTISDGQNTSAPYQIYVAPVQPINASSSSSTFSLSTIATAGVALLSLSRQFWQWYSIRKSRRARHPLATKLLEYLDIDSLGDVESADYRGYTDAIEGYIVGNERRPGLVDFLEAEGCAFKDEKGNISDEVSAKIVKAIQSVTGKDEYTSCGWNLHCRNKLKILLTDIQKEEKLKAIAKKTRQLLLGAEGSNVLSSATPSHTVVEMSLNSSSSSMSEKTSASSSLSISMTTSSTSLSSPSSPSSSSFSPLSSPSATRTTFFASPKSDSKKSPPPRPAKSLCLRQLSASSSFSSLSSSATTSVQATSSPVQASSSANLSTSASLFRSPPTHRPRPLPPTPRSPSSMSHSITSATSAAVA